MNHKVLQVIVGTQADMKALKCENAYLMQGKDRKY